MLDDFGQRIRDIILSEMDLSRELSDEEICDLIGSVVSREARDRPMTIKDKRSYQDGSSYETGQDNSGRVQRCRGA